MNGVRRIAWLRAYCAFAAAGLSAAGAADSSGGAAREVLAAAPFEVAEASIADIQSALLSKRVTTEQVVRAYLARIRAYNGTCVKEPQGILGVIEPIPHAGQINALITLNLRPANRKALGLDERKARSMTDAQDSAANMPDALEVAAAQDRQLAATGKLVGPLQGVVFSIKDQYDTFDMRSTAGQDVAFANDRPPDDAHFIAKLRAAGAIILAKANLGEGGSQRSRSSFGGTMCNPYDTTRSPGSSSGGSGSSVGASLVTCSIGEETGGSILHPARNASAVGLAPTQQLVSQDGIIGKGFNHRVGPICRSVEDAARVLEVIAGYDADDEITAFSIGRLPSQPYSSFAREKRLDGVRIGVVREFMDKDLFTVAAHEPIDIAERAIDDLRSLGATVVDPGPHGALFQGCVDKYAPLYRNKLFTKGATIRDLGPVPESGEGRYFLEQYLRERGDANIRTIDDLMGKAQFFTDLRPGSDFTSYKEQLARTASAKELDLAAMFQNRLAYQTIVLQCMGTLKLDAVTYGSGIGVTPVLGSPYEPSKNNSPNANSIWGVIAANGFPSLNVPAGFTTQVYDRVRDASAPDGSRMLPPKPARLPVSITFLARPFDEPLLFKIGSAYEAATHHREPPPEFGLLPLGRQ
jgi:amidase